MKPSWINAGYFVINSITKTCKGLVHPNGKGGKVMFDVIEIQGCDVWVLINITVIIPDQETIENRRRMNQKCKQKYQQKVNACPLF
jgi:hypothetical protein